MDEESAFVTGLERGSSGSPRIHATLSRASLSHADMTHSFLFCHKFTTAGREGENNG